MKTTDNTAHSATATKKLHSINNLPKYWHFRETPGHGYLVPGMDANKLVPSFLRENEYEEDCAWCIPIIFNRDLFDSKTIESALITFKNWYPKEYKKVIGEIKPGESTLNDSYLQAQANIGNFMKAGCYGDWCYDIKEGMVYMELCEIVKEDIKENTVIRASGKEISVQVPQEIYAAKNIFTFAELEKFLYKRNDTYYTWEEFTEKTGKQKPIQYQTIKK